MSEATEREIEISSLYTPAERKAIAIDIINYLQKRTKKGLGPDGKPWEGPAGEYSDSYRQSLDFKQKRNKGKVTLELSGDMLTSIALIESNRGKLKYGVPSGDAEEGRAEGNILGTYGQAEPIEGKARDFLSLSSEEIKRILKNYPLDDREKSRIRALKNVSLNEVMREVFLGI